MAERDLSPARHFLIIDDDPIFLTVADAVLRSLGNHEISTACDGEQGLSLLHSVASPVDTIILDLNMPKLDGLAFLRAAAESGFDGDVIISSGEAAAIVNAARHLAGQLGVRIAGVLSKPITPEAVLKVLADMPANAGTGSATGPTPDQGPDPAGRVVAYYQPQCDLKSGRVMGLEALTRLVTADGRIFGPDRIFGLKLGRDQVVDATFDIIGEVFHNQREWQDRGVAVHVSINMDADVLDETATLPRILAMQEEFGVDANLVTFEMTETALPHDMSRLIEILARLRMKGFGVSLDDFGTGAANFELLRMCPFSELKIDQSVVQSAAHEKTSRSFMEFCVAAATELKIEIVAEGIETPAQRDLCLSLGVQRGQGYLLGRPAPKAETDSILQRHIEV